VRHRITVDEIPAAGHSFHVDEGQSAFRDVLAEALEHDGSHRCSADVFIERRERRLHISGSVAGELRQACARCASDFAQPIERRIRAVLVLDPVDSEDEEELDPGDLDESYLDGNVVDLLELVREQVLLALPHKPLCRADCRGLCPRCGVDFNHETCSCEDDTVDPRLSVLADLEIDES